MSVFPNQSARSARPSAVGEHSEDSLLLRWEREPSRGRGARGGFGPGRGLRRVGRRVHERRARVSTRRAARDGALPGRRSVSTRMHDEERLRKRGRPASTQPVLVADEGEPDAKLEQEVPQVPHQRLLDLPLSRLILQPEEAEATAEATA